jgi:hypothetical protein
MNLFFLQYTAVQCASVQADVHVVKMILETMQMLCTALHYSRSPLVFPFELYKPTHANHPSTKWVRHSLTHFLWAVEHGIALCEEYTRRYKKRHKCHDLYLVLKDLRPHFEELNFDTHKITRTDIPFGLDFIVLAIADDVFDECAVYQDENLLGVQTYKNYYLTKRKTMKKRKMQWYKTDTLPDELVFKKKVKEAENL